LRLHDKIQRIGIIFDMYVYLTFRPE
jgi:hypothetical protein